eukprot:TRINITY_DN24142_c0_g1_i2.p1 TRINITY_DN24142_c0_g1~~TRINITY_DN24142_c0_g1_i2.p1  ORF type:complete len:702 (-),score=195.61 TRINITY_DN24142_c0_g1_i2:3-2054(-)
MVTVRSQQRPVSQSSAASASSSAAAADVASVEELRAFAEAKREVVSFLRETLLAKQQVLETRERLSEELARGVAKSMASLEATATASARGNGRSSKSAAPGAGASNVDDAEADATEAAAEGGGGPAGASALRDLLRRTARFADRLRLGKLQQGSASPPASGRSGAVRGKAGAPAASSSSASSASAASASAASAAAAAAKGPAAVLKAAAQKADKDTSSSAAAAAPRAAASLDVRRVAAASSAGPATAAAKPAAGATAAATSAAASAPTPAASSSAKAADEPVTDVEEDDEAVVTLHVYDVSGDARVTAFNNLAHQMGTGAFHAGVEVYGVEWSYGWSAHKGQSGVYWNQPRQNSSHLYREPVRMGRTLLSRQQARELIAELSSTWLGLDYDLLARNCCHFSDALCQRLGVGEAPRYVTHLASTSVAVLKAVVVASQERDRLMSEAAQLAATKATELDQQFSLVDRIEAFSCQEVHVDEEVLEEKVRGLWSHAVDSVGWLGELAQQAVEEVQKPVSVEPLETKALDLWAMAVRRFSAPETLISASLPSAGAGSQPSGREELVEVVEVAAGPEKRSASLPSPLLPGEEDDDQERRQEARAKRPSKGVACGGLLRHSGRQPLPTGDDSPPEPDSPSPRCGKCAARRPSASGSTTLGDAETQASTAQASLEPAGETLAVPDTLSLEL